MPLSEDERKRLHDEEVYRAEVRRSLEGVKPPPSVWGRIASILDSKFGFWIFTALLATSSAALFTSFSDWLHHDAIVERQRAERARQDFDTVIKVVPMLTSENAGNRQIGFSLLNGLASAKSIQPEIATQITSTLQSIVVAGTAPNASPEARTRADEFARLVDAASASPADTQPASASASPTALPGHPAPPLTTTLPTTTRIAPAIVAVALPPRVYVQIGAESRRDDANKAVEALRAAGVLAPGIEKVTTVPRKNQLRFCDEKMLDASRTVVVRALESVAIPVDLAPLPPRMCGNVRPNHFELWLGSGTA